MGGSPLQDTDYRKSAYTFDSTAQDLTCGCASDLTSMIPAPLLALSLWQALARRCDNLEI